jgi:threonine aldolase
MTRTHDLRSDTVTRPTEGMRRAMATAEVGDDCYGDDPTVRELEARAAERLGKAAAVFVPSGTMANQLAVRLHTRPGTAIATHPGAHVRIHEDASAAALSGAQIMPVGGRHGFRVGQLRALMDEESCGWPPVRLVWLESTIGDAGGVPWPRSATGTDLRPDAPDGLEQIATFVRARGRALHLDGARLWNHHVATADALSDLAAHADTVSACFSKGLGAPMGSVLCGPADAIAEARRMRHAMGGSMRQAGIAAAAALYALEHHVERLAEDHRRATALAQAIIDLPVWEVEAPATNIVIARVRAPDVCAEDLCAPLRAAGVLCHPNVHREVRLCVHLGIDDNAIVDVAARIRAVLG